MKQTSAPGPRSAARKSIASQSAKGRVKKFGKQVLDRVFLRSKMWEMRKEVRDVSSAVPDLERSLDVSVTLLSKKIDYLQAKIDAYADVDDRNYVALQEDLKSRQEALDARLAAIEKSGAELAGALAAEGSHVTQAVEDIHGRMEKLERMARRAPRAAEPKEKEPAPVEPAAEGEATVLIEVLGPSGVGKSTILRAAQALRSPQEMWWGPDEIEATRAAASADRLKHRDALDGFSPPGFVSRCLEILASSQMLPSQVVSAATTLRWTCQAAIAVRNLSSRHPLVHDELLLHRASALLLYSEAFEDHAVWYFESVPVPDAAIVLRADTETIVKRIHERGTLLNTYYNLDDDALREIVERSLRLTEIAAERLRARGVAVTEIDAGEDLSKSARMVHEFASGRHAKTPSRRAKVSQ